MSFQFKTIGAYKQVRNNPRCKATRDVKNGMVVIPDDVTGSAPTPVTANDAKGDVWVVFNVIDKPEVLSSKDFTIKAGEEVRAFRLKDLAGMHVELGQQVLKDSYDSVAEGDLLVPCDDSVTGHEGKWMKVDSTVAAEYAINLKVTKKTTFADKGLECLLVTKA